MEYDVADKGRDAPTRHNIQSLCYPLICNAGINNYMFYKHTSGEGDSDTVVDGTTGVLIKNDL